MDINFINEQTSIKLSSQMRDGIFSVLKILSVLEDIDFSLNILFTDNAYIAKLNSDFRGINGPTDVLSFPAYELNGPLKYCLADINLEYIDGAPFIGDIAISLEQAVLQAKDIGNSELKEIVFLALHGALHLLGYDHTDEACEYIMIGKQRAVMDKMNF